MIDKLKQISMDPVTFSIASNAIKVVLVVCQGIKWLNGLQPAIDKAYSRALKRWAPKKGLRKLYADEQVATLQKLSSYITDRKSVTGDIKILLDYFEEELKKDAVTYSQIIEILARENLSVSQESLLTTKEISDKLTEGFDTVSLQNYENKELLLQILESVNPTSIPQKIYTKVDDYIPRKVREYSEFDIQIYISKEKYEPKPLAQHIVEGTKRIVLYSNAQIGKSTELKNLAFELHDSGLYNPFLFNLSYYSKKTTITTQLQIHERFGSDKLNVLILDGLDEVPDVDRNEVIKEIEFITENYPDLHIVVACRKNFEGTNSISEFKKLYLNELSWNEAKAYIESTCRRISDTLIQSIEENEYFELTQNPFYLKEIIEYYEKNGTLPANKSVIYDYVIAKSFIADKGRSPQKGMPVSPKTKLYPTIEKIAFCLQVTQRQEFSTDELYSEFDIKEEEIHQLLTCSLLSSDEDNNVKFVHNSFKEYIFAKHLSQLSFDRVQATICYSGTTKIQTSMYNTTVLLLSIVQKTAPLFIPLIDWLKTKHTKILVECGEEMLDEQQRNQIFKELFNDYKKKGLWIEYDFSDRLIRFANTKEILQFLLNEIKMEKDYTPNMINALNMLKYTKFSMLHAAELDLATNLLLELLNKYKDRCEYETYLFRPFENKELLNKTIISEVYNIIEETVNCNIINYFCTLISKAGVSDDYAHWVFSKAEHIHDYSDSGGVTHSVSTEYLYRVFRSFNNPHNIVKAIVYANNHKDKDYVWNNKKTLFETLFANLSKYSDGSPSIIDEVILAIRSANEWEISTSYINGFYNFLKARTDTQKLFREYYSQAKKSFIDHAKDNSKGREYAQDFNVVVLLLNEERLDTILSDTSFPDESLHCWFCSHLRTYPSIPGDFITKIQTRFAECYKPQVDWEKRRQAEFDILFEQDAFCREIEKICGTRDRIDSSTEARMEIMKQVQNSSVLGFIMQYRKEGEDYVDTSIVSVKAKDKVEFARFVLNQLPIPSHQRNEAVVISPAQKVKLTEIVKHILNNPRRIYDVGRLMNIIVEYKLPIEDKLLLTLLTYSGFSNSKFFLDYLEGTVSEKSVVDEIEKMILSEVTYESYHWEIFVKHIVDHKKTRLYRHFERLLTINDSYRLNLALHINGLGREGINIMKPLLHLLNEDELVYYYREILLPEDKSILNLIEKNEIRQILEDKYHDCIDTKLKEEILILLVLLGSIKALDWCLEYAKANAKWANQCHFPSLHKYEIDKIDKILEYFDFATSINIPERAMQSILDSSIYALRQFANESEDIRDKVVALFSEKAHENPKFSYLYRIAEETFDKYFEMNYGIETIKVGKKIYEQNQTCS